MMSQFVCLTLGKTSHILIVDTNGDRPIRTRVQKWGNSLALRIPKAFADEVGLRRGGTVELSSSDGQLVVAAVTEPEYALDDMLTQITEDNVHGEIDTGPAVGHEVW